MYKELKKWLKLSRMCNHIFVKCTELEPNFSECRSWVMEIQLQQQTALQKLLLGSVRVSGW